jgi:polar amino acid transport system substrate-binding protein
MAGTEKPALIMVGDNLCPYNCAPEAARRGYMIDILERVLGPHYTLTYKLAPWTRAIHMVETDEAQLLIATPANTEQKIVASAPLGVDQSCFFVRKGNPWRFSRLGDLKEVRLGVVQDYNYDDNGPLDALIAGYRKRKDAKLEVAVGENALESNFRKLEAGRMDVVVENENVGRYMIQELKLKDSIDFAHCATHHVATTHVAVSLKRPDAKQILATINSGLQELRRTGELTAILKPYGMSDWQHAKVRKPAH